MEGTVLKMEEKEIQIFNEKNQEEIIEPEIVSEGKSSKNNKFYEETTIHVQSEKPSLVSKFKRAIILPGLFLGFILIILGIVLSLTIIGAIIGIPLILAGSGLIWCVLKISRKGFFIFKNF